MSGPWSLAVAGPYTVPFAAFALKASVGLGTPTIFNLNGTFNLGAGSNGIIPTTEEVVLEVGTFSTTIPAGSFVFRPAKKNTLANYTFDGEIDSVLLDVKITELGSGRFSCKRRDRARI